MRNAARRVCAAELRDTGCLNDEEDCTGPEPEVTVARQGSPAVHAGGGGGAGRAGQVPGPPLGLLPELA